MQNIADVASRLSEETKSDRFAAEANSSKYSLPDQESLSPDSDVYSGQGWQKFLDLLNANQAVSSKANLA